MPNFLKSRTKNSISTSTASISTTSSSTSSISWLGRAVNFMIQQISEQSTSPENNQGKGSAESSPKPSSDGFLKGFSAKKFQPPNLSLADIEIRASKELDKFFIDPTAASVELAEERCLLLQSDSLSVRFYCMIKRLLGQVYHTKLKTVTYL